MDAAVHVFAKQGFYNSTVADVARMADVADGTIYLYFKNKDDLLISIFEHSIQFFIGSAYEELKGAKNAVDKLKKFVYLHLKLVQNNPHLAHVIQVELRQSAKFVKEYANEKFFEYLNIVRSVIEEGQQQGLFKKSLNPTLVKRAIFGAIDEMALEWVLMNKKRYSIEEAAKELCLLFIEGMMERKE